MLCFVIAHQAFANAMFIIFLGIIPFMAIVALLYYYMKHNLRFGRSKSSTPTYVTQYLRNLVGACKGVGRKPSINIPTISDRVTESQPQIRKLEITPTVLVSTTNSVGITRSNTIGKNDKNDEPIYSNLSNAKPESSFVSGVRRMSFKNFRNLKLNTGLGFRNRSDSSCSSPQTAETVVATPDTQNLSVKDMAKKFGNVNLSFNRT